MQPTQPRRIYVSPLRDDCAILTPAIQQLCYPGWTDITHYDAEQMGDLVAEILAVD